MDGWVARNLEKRRNMENEPCVCVCVLHDAFTLSPFSLFCVFSSLSSSTQPPPHISPPILLLSIIHSFLSPHLATPPFFFLPSLLVSPVCQKRSIVPRPS